MVEPNRFAPRKSTVQTLTPYRFHRAPILERISRSWTGWGLPFADDRSGFVDVPSGDDLGDALGHALVEDCLPTGSVSADQVRSLALRLRQLSDDLGRMAESIESILVTDAHAMLDEPQPGESAIDAGGASRILEP